MLWDTFILSSDILLEIVLHYDGLLNNTMSALLFSGICSTEGSFNLGFFKLLAFKVEAIYLSSKKMLQGYHKNIPEVTGYESSSSRLRASPRNKNALLLCTKRFFKSCSHVSG